MKEINQALQRANSASLLKTGLTLDEAFELALLKRELFQGAFSLVVTKEMEEDATYQRYNELSTKRFQHICQLQRQKN